VLSRERVRNYSTIFALGSLLALGSSTVLRLVNPARFGVALPDYLAHWTAGRMVLDGLAAVLYSPQAQWEVQSQLAGTRGHLAWFVSPPFVAGLYAPLALLPYAASAVVWTAISLGVLSACVSRMGEFCATLWATERRLIILVIAASYPVFELLGGGQDSALSLAVWMAGMHLIARNRDATAGAVFALGLIKPQLVVLVPVVFLAQRRWRALAAFAVTGALIILGGVALVGWDGMTAWLDAIGSPLYAHEVTVGQSWKMASFPALATALASPLGTGTASVVGYVLAGVMGVVFVLWAGRRGPSQSALLPAALATTVAASPHLVLYDAVLFIPVVLVLLENRWTTRRVRVSVAFAFVLAWLAPALHAVVATVGESIGVLDAPWVAIPIAVLWWRMLSIGEVGRDGSAVA
jgi:Glycosyltransferase family 87